SHVEDRRQQLAMVDANREVSETKLGERVRQGGTHLGLDHRRRRAKRIDIALAKLTKAPARGTVGAPYRLNLVALEQSRKLALIMRDDARERHRQVVAQCQVCLPAGF